VKNWGWGSEMQPLLENQLGYSNSFYAITKPRTERNLVVEAFFDCLQDALKKEMR
jgi:hypothetical protein